MRLYPYMSSSDVIHSIQVALHSVFIDLHVFKGVILCGRIGVLLILPNRGGRLMNSVLLRSAQLGLDKCRNKPRSLTGGYPPYLR